MERAKDLGNLQHLRKVVGDYTWIFYKGVDNLYYWEVINLTTYGRSHTGYSSIEECVENASINGYTELAPILDCWEFYYCVHKGYKWVHLSVIDGDILGESCGYYKTRKECVDNASIFGF